MKVKEFLKKYHVIAYLIMVAVIMVVGMSVKWYRYTEYIGYGGTLGYAYKYFNILLGYILVAATILFYLLVIRKTDIEKAFLAVSLLMGTLFILLMPPDTPADEDKHMFAVTEFSNGVIGVNETKEPFMATYRECDANSGFTRLVSISNYIRLGQKLTERAGKTTYVTYEVEHFNYDKSTFVLYLPAIIGMIISKLLGLGTVMMYFTARFFMLLVYSVVGYFAVRKIPTGKALLAIIMALPTSLSRAACVSQDGILHAFIFLFMSYIVYFAFSGNQMKVKEVIVTVLSAAVLVFGKGGAYTPLLLMLFLIPKENFGKKVRYPVVVGLSVLLAVIFFFISHPGLFMDLVGSGRGTEDELLWNENPSYTINDLVRNPGHSVKMFFGTAVAFLGQFFGEMISGGFGWLQISSSPLIVTGCFLLILMAALSEQNQTIVMNKKQRIITGVSVAGAVGLVVLSMWIFWTPVTFGYIAGIQGRYFIVMLFPIMLMLRNNRISIKNNVENKSMIVLSGLIILAVFEFWTKISG